MKKHLHLLFASAIALMSLQAQATILNISVADFSFIPSGSSASAVTINLGDTVRWNWSSGSHTTTSLTIPSGATAWDQAIHSGATTFTYIPSASGTYNYKCTPHFPGMVGSFIVQSCTGPSKATITSANGNAACAGSAVMLSIPAQAGATYQWYKNGGSIANVTNSLNATTTGAYTIKVSRCSLFDSSAAFSVTINNPPVPSFTTANTALAYTFTNTTASAASNTYVWSFSDGSPNQTTTNASRTFAAPGTYTVTLKATNIATTCVGTGSPFTIQATLGVGNLAGASYSISPNPTCKMVDVKTSVPSTISLCDMNGKVLGNSTISQASTAHQIDLSAFSTGMYFLRIATADGAIVEKITVIH